MSQDEIIRMAKQAGFYQTGHASYQVFTATIQDFAKLVAEKAFQDGFYAGFKASGEGWNGECPFNDLGLDIQQNESIQHELKLAIRAREQA